MTPHEAVQKDDARALSNLGKDRRVLSSPDGSGYTPLQLACELGRIGRVEQLLSLSVDIEAPGEERITALMIAALEGQAAICELLLRAGADPARYDDHGNTPLHLGAMRGHVEVVRFLLDHAPQTALMYNREGLRAAALAAIEGHAECVRAFVERLGTSQAVETLQQAAAFGQTDVVQLLLDVGTPVDIQDSGGRTALHWAVQEARLEVIDVLLRLGADPNVAGGEPGGTYDNSILGLAAADGNTDVISRLLAGGARVDAPDRNGLTPLHFAAIYKQPEAVKVLLLAGAPPQVRDKDGLRPVDHARRRRCRRVVRILDGAAGAV